MDAIQFDEVAVSVRPHSVYVLIGDAEAFRSLKAIVAHDDTGGTARSIETVSEPFVLPAIALISTDPLSSAVTRPPLLTVATDGFDDCHVALEVIGLLEPSAATATAVN